MHAIAPRTKAPAPFRPDRDVHAERTCVVNAGEWEGYVSAIKRAEQAEAECARLRDELERLHRLVPTGTYTLNVQYEEEIQRLKDAGEVLVRSLERMTRERDELMRSASHQTEK